MGGRAFGFDAKRMDKDEYEDVLALTLARIESSHDFKLGRGVLSVNDKESFGDVDILIPSEFFFFEWFWDNHKHRYKEYKSNGGVISLLDKQNRQIDLITTPKAIFDTHFAYLNYNDLGNFLGRIAKSINLKYGHDGLWLIVRDKEDVTRKIGQILISTDNHYIYELLDVYYPARGEFNSMEEVYSSIMESKYYHKDLFLLEKQSHHARLRDRKRKSYQGMLTYISENDTSAHDRRRYSIYETLHMLPDAVSIDYIKQCALCDKRRYDKTLFNGNIVRELTGLQGKELGAFIKSISKEIDIFGDVNNQINAKYAEYKQNDADSYVKIYQGIKK